MRAGCQHVSWNACATDTMGQCGLKIQANTRSSWWTKHQCFKSVCQKKTLWGGPMLTSESGEQPEQSHSSPGLLEVKLCRWIQGQPLSFFWKAHAGTSAHPFNVCGPPEWRSRHRKINLVLLSVLYTNDSNCWLVIEYNSKLGLKEKYTYYPKFRGGKQNMESGSKLTFHTDISSR